MADVNTNVGVNIELNSSNSSDYLNMIEKTVDGMEELKKKLEEVGISFDSIMSNNDSLKNMIESTSSGVSYFNNVSNALYLDCNASI